MKTIFVEAHYDKKVIIPKKVLDRLPSKIMLFMTAQLIPQKENLIKQLEDANKEVLLHRVRHTVHEGQILGCDTEKINAEFDAFFYIGDGMFHPQALIIKNDKPVHIYNHAQKKYSVLTSKDAFLIRKQLQTARMKFLMSKEIGVLVTTKPGQNKLGLFEKIKNKYDDKNFYYLVNNNVEFDKLEDFPFIECFVNTACERIAYDDFNKFPRTVINFEDLP